MMSLEIFIKIILFLFPLAYSPGPGNMFFAINGARFGYGRTMAANIGYHLATWIVAYAIGLVYLSGLSTLPHYLESLKYIGSLYIVYLSFMLFRAGTLTEVEEAKPASFIDGVLLLVLNPKAYVIILLLFTQFLTVSDAESHSYLFIVASIFTINNFIAFFMWTVLGDVLLKKYRSSSDARILNKIFGIVLFLVGVWILLS